MEVNRLRVVEWLVELVSRVGLVEKSGERSFYNCKKTSHYFEPRTEADAKHQWRIIMSKMML